MKATKKNKKPTSYLRIIYMNSVLSCEDYLLSKQTKKEQSTKNEIKFAQFDEIKEEISKIYCKMRNDQKENVYIPSKLGNQIKWWERNRGSFNYELYLSICREKTKRS